MKRVTNDGSADSSLQVRVGGGEVVGELLSAAMHEHEGVVAQMHPYPQRHAAWLAAMREGTDKMHRDPERHDA